MTASLKQLNRQEARARRRWIRCGFSICGAEWKHFKAIRLRVLLREDEYVAAGKFVRKEG